MTSVHWHLNQQQQKQQQGTTLNSKAAAVPAGADGKYDGLDAGSSSSRRTVAGICGSRDIIYIAVANNSCRLAMLYVEACSFEDGGRKDIAAAAKQFSQDSGTTNGSSRLSISHQNDRQQQHCWPAAAGAGYAHVAAGSLIAIYNVRQWHLV